MLNTVLGLKNRMSQTFIEGTRVSVTIVKTGTCVVTKLGNVNGKQVVQLGCGTKKTKNISNALAGHLKGAIKDGKVAPRFLRDVVTDAEPGVSVGEQVKVEKIFKKGDVVTVTGTSKGKGFAGGVKRWGFAGGPKTHGQSDRHRAPGSIGQGTTPGRVLKGKKMAGRLGSDKVTVQNLMVVNVLPEANEIWISGSVPGTKGGLLSIKKVKAGSLADLVTEAPVVEEQVAEDDTAKAEA